MSMIDFSPYEAQRRATGQQFGATSARNAYAQFLSKTRGNRNLALMREQYAKQAPNVIGSFVRRGMVAPNVKSGVYESGLQDFARQAQRDQQDLQEQLDQQQMMSGLEQADLEAGYRSALADIEAQKAREIRDAASTLSSFKPFLG